MHILRILLILLLPGQSLATQAFEPKPFELGIVPYLPTANLISAYQPLRSLMEEKLKRPVALSTAPDFTIFLERCLRKEYDAIVLGPGLGRFVQIDAGYRPLAVTKRNVKALILVERNAPYTGLKDLAGRRVAMLDPIIALSQLGTEVFRQAGMKQERDFRVQIVKSPSNVIHAVLQGEAEAGVTTANLIPQLSEDMKRRLRILTESREIPGLMFMFLPADHPHPGQLQEILLQFEKTEAGRKFMESLAMDGLRIPAEEEMRAMDSFLPEFRRRFKR